MNYESENKQAPAAKGCAILTSVIHKLSQAGKYMFDQNRARELLVRAHAATHQTSRWSLLSRWSIASIGSVASIASFFSIASFGSILSIGSTGSILSIGSTGSILSIGSTGSILSIGKLGALRGHQRAMRR